jgi:formate hydrogenlyase transcriptional activator
MAIRPEHLLSSGSLEYLLFDASLRITEHSAGAARLADHPESVVVGNDIRLAFPEFVGVEDEILRVAMGSKSSLSIRSVCRLIDAHSSLYVDVRVRACPPSGPEAPLMMLTLEDVTQWMNEIQRKAQTTNDAMLLIHAMTASKEYIENILDAMADMLIVTSPDGAISAVNRAAVALTEYSTAELIGQPITFLLPDELPSGRAQHAWHGPPVERSCLTKNGEAVPVSFSRAPLGSGDQAIHGIVFLGRDLRDQKRAEARISRLESEKLSLQEALQTTQTGTDIVWTSPAMGVLMRDLGKVAVTDTTVLIMGETGTGKELIAREIHRLSPRKDALLVTVNCAALPSGLVESELFGHERGSFTGALQKRVGRFELANGGTVFLDEIGELPLPAQATLLRVLQEQTLERVGGSQAIGVNVRVIAATNRDLQDEVRKGRFREDLLFRLNVFPLPVPPLRERVEDILLLARHFVHLFARRTNRHVTSIHPDALRALRSYRWPGNVRELANVIERAMIVCEGSVLEVSHLALVDTPRTGETEVVRFDDIARRHLLQTLEECGGVIEGPEGAAARLGLKPATLRSRLKKLGISRTRAGFSPAPSP